MNIPLLSYLVNLIEEILTKEAPVVAGAATKAALQTAESDPKVEAISAASEALLSAAQDMKAAVNEHPDAPEIIPATK